MWGSVRDSVYGQHDAHWLGFYEFFRNVTNLISETRPVDGLIEFAQHAGWAIPHEKICWISERTEIVCQDDQKRLHCINGPAVRYPDGWELYYLWGVKVPREWIMQSPNEMNVAQFASIKNAEQRAVYIRKMGIHKLYDHGTIIHSQEGYDLVDMQTLLDLDRPAPYLFMTNPSTGEKHAEGVAPECRTVDEAINWRAGGVRWAPEILT